MQLPTMIFHEICSPMMVEVYRWKVYKQSSARKLHIHNDVFSQILSRQIWYICS